jgi:hypothetical protein
MEIRRRQDYGVVVAFRDAGEYQHQYSVLDLPMVLKESRFNGGSAMPVRSNLLIDLGELCQKDIE